MPSADRAESAESTSDSGAIVGGVVGGILALLLIIALVAWLVVRRRRDTPREKAADVDEVPLAPVQPQPLVSNYGMVSASHRPSHMDLYDSSFLHAERANYDDASALTKSSVAHTIYSDAVVLGNEVNVKSQYQTGVLTP